MLVNNELRVGLARVMRRVGRVLVEDPYVKEEFVLVDDIPIGVEPTLPAHVPVRLAECVYLDLGTPVVVSGTTSMWVTIPYELRVAAGERVLKVLSPFRVKHTVVGTPYEGIICRWFKSAVISNPSSWDRAEGLGKILVESPTPEVVKGIYVRLNMLKLYVRESPRLQVFYGTMKGHVRDNIVYVSGVEESPPAEGLREVRGLVEHNTARYFHMEFREGP